ncbi:MAG: multiheme c-type cytochrome, partial [Puniceicoccales bacterium]
MSGLTLLAGLAFWACQPKEQPSGDGQRGQSPRPVPGQSARMPATFFPERLARMGPQTCVECHSDIHADWAKSHHAHANRPVDSIKDDRAFTPSRELLDGGVTTTLSKQAGEFVIKVNEADGSITNETLTGVIAYDPLIQYLAPQENGAYQTTSVAYDPAKNEWFEVFSGEDRLPGEWGHWMGQGMNWNANCAACHMTDYDKNFDWRTGEYDSTWLQQGISCAQCHNGLVEHLRD